jgi:heme oxygenase
MVKSEAEIEEELNGIEKEIERLEELRIDILNNKFSKRQTRKKINAANKDLTVLGERISTAMKSVSELIEEDSKKVSEEYDRQKQSK